MAICAPWPPSNCSFCCGMPIHCKSSQMIFDRLQKVGQTSLVRAHYHLMWVQNWLDCGSGCLSLRAATVSCHRIRNVRTRYNLPLGRATAHSAGRMHPERDCRYISRRPVWCRASGCCVWYLLCYCGSPRVQLACPSGTRGGLAPIPHPEPELRIPHRSYSRDSDIS
jgi:hypothetical protein